MPQKPSTGSYVNDANDLSILFASLLPFDPSDVGPFLFEAAYALGEREADLAREIGVSRATLSGWKKRGAIPPAHLEWFGERFPIEVLQGRNPQQHEGFRHVGLELALALFEMTSFDPFNLPHKGKEDRLAICFRYLGGISRLGLFVLHRCQADPSRASVHINDRWWSEVLPKLREITALAGPHMF